jgi:2-keto-4-pentenoate hydratase/2-oxohepta-3-ene-1,7-dioic acid hydratase in catechol pathway
MNKYQLGTARIDGRETPLVNVGGQAHVLSDVLTQSGRTNPPASVLSLLNDWGRWRNELRTAVDKYVPTAAHAVDLARVQMMSPVTAPPKIICIGANYRDHIREMKTASVPEWPYAFLRPRTSLTGHAQDIVLPKDPVTVGPDILRPNGPTMIDWEAELCVVIGASVRNVRSSEALDAVAGYTIANDISARDWIPKRPPVGTDWVIQKAWDSFQPTGPWLTPAEFVPNPQSLAIELRLNGVVKQRSNTDQMVFSVAEIIAHLSQMMTLEPGDLILTGTPHGVGMGRNPPEFMKPGDVVRVTIENLGVLENRLI